MGFLTSNEVAELLSVAPSTVWRMVRRGEFPQPIRFNRKLVRWNLNEVEHWFRANPGQTELTAKR